MKIYRSFKRPHVRLNRACVTHVIGVHTHSRTYCDARTHIRERNIAAMLLSAISGWFLHKWIALPEPLF